MDKIVAIEADWDEFGSAKTMTIRQQYKIAVVPLVVGVFASSRQLVEMVGELADKMIKEDMAHRQKMKAE